jgi:hypothetical protein
VLRVGSRLGAYEITGHIGAGSMPTGSPPRTQPQPPAHSVSSFPFPDRATTWSLEPTKRCHVTRAPAASSGTSARRRPSR